MPFFEKIRKKLRRRNVIRMIVSILMMSWFGAGIAICVFYNDIDFKIFSFGTDFGIPVPNWLMSLGFVFMIAIFAFIFVGSLKSAFKNTEYLALLESAHKLGNIEYVDEILSDLPKNPLTKGGDLRFNDRLLFYLKDTDVFLIGTDTIISVQPIRHYDKSKLEFFVEILSENKRIRISVKEKNVIPLATAITYEVIRGRQMHG
ncbi:MAG: hypothetical protein K6G90_10470 [Clostridia bacterium]|nr:hypothetical protein [Clostridia bacterium]